MVLPKLVFLNRKLEGSSISPDLCCFQSSHLVFSLERCGVPDKFTYSVGINPERFRMAVLQEVSQISLESYYEIPLCPTSGALAKPWTHGSPLRACLLTSPPPHGALVVWQSFQEGSTLSSWRLP